MYIVLTPDTNHYGSVKYYNVHAFDDVTEVKRRLSNKPDEDGRKTRAFKLDALKEIASIDVNFTVHLKDA